MSRKSDAKQRWHDNQGELSRTVELLEHLPETILPYITDALLGKADREFNATDILNSLKSLGKDKIMALHQSRKKRRSYDAHPSLHQIVNTLFVIPDNFQESVASQFLELSGLMVDYMATCDSFDLAPQENELVEMRNLFIEEGPDSVHHYLHQIHEPYYAKMLKVDDSDANLPHSENPTASDTLILEGRQVKTKPIDQSSQPDYQSD